MEIKRCPSCGAELTQNEEKKLICPYCGTEIISEENNNENKGKKHVLLFAAIGIAFAIIVGIIVFSTKETKEVNNSKDYQIYRINDVNKLRVDDHLIFGTFEQDNDINTKDEIEWIVLTNNGEELTLISSFGLDSIRYKDIDKWLDDTLMNSFNEDEKKYIIDSSILNDLNAELYFETDEDRICIASSYAVANGAHVYDESNKCWWWIYTTDLKNGPFNVRTDGHIKYVDTDINADGYVIRPVLTISTKPIEKKEEAKTIVNKKTIIEVLDTQMNVYTTVDKQSTKNGVVYQGDRFEVISYYETPGYKWYQIGADQWLGDGNGERIKLISGNLNNEFVEIDQEKIINKNEEKRKTLINKIQNLPQHTLSCCMGSYDIDEETSKQILSYYNNKTNEISSISFRAIIDFNKTVEDLVKLKVDEDNKKISIIVYLYGKINSEKIEAYSIYDLKIYDESYKKINNKDYADENLTNILFKVPEYTFDCSDYKSANEIVYGIEVLVKELYPDYELLVTWKD